MLGEKENNFILFSLCAHTYTHKTHTARTYTHMGGSVFFFSVCALVCFKNKKKEKKQKKMNSNSSTQVISMAPLGGGKMPQNLSRLEYTTVEQRPSFVAVFAHNRPALLLRGKPPLFLLTDYGEK